MTDWLAHIRVNGNTALKELYELYRNECVAWVVKQYNLDEDFAKDAFQVSILVLYQNVVKGKVSHLSSGIKTYLFGIVKNKAREMIKVESRYQKEGKAGVLKEELTEEVDEKIKFEAIMERVRRAMIYMGDPCKSLLQLYYFKRMKLKEISVVMGDNKMITTKSKKHKCMERLRKIVIHQKPVIVGI